MAKKIALEREAREIGGNSIVVSTTKCATMQKAIDFGCKRISSYALNQLVPLVDLEKNAAYSFLGTGTLHWATGATVKISINAEADWWIKQTALSFNYSLLFKPMNGSAGKGINIIGTLNVSKPGSLVPTYVEVGLFNSSASLTPVVTQHIMVGSIG